jgi:hypothetical protein
MEQRRQQVPGPKLNRLRTNVMLASDKKHRISFLKLAYCVKVDL